MVPGFRTRVRSGEKFLGTMLTLASPAVAEILADAGFDWLFIDCEHGAMNEADVQAILQAVGHRMACIVRVPSGSEPEIKRILDVGAQGIIVPQVNTAAQAADVVKFSRYAPLGSRGVGLGRAQGYGSRFADYVATANDEIIVIVQAEHRLAVENIHSIVQVPGIDCILLGPYDLSASYHKMGQINDPEVTAAIDRVLSHCRNAGLPVGYFGVTAEAVREHSAKGCSMLVSGVDVVFLGSSAKKMFKEMQ